MWEKIPTYAAIFVSVLALATSIWSANETRQHDRLSVQPHLHYWRDMQSPYVGLTLINEGLGPAHILETRVYFEGKQVNNWETVIAGTRSLYDAEPDWFMRPSDWFLLNGARQGIFATHQSNVKNMREFEDLIYRRIFVISRYCSIYDECVNSCSLAIPQDQCPDVEEKVKHTKF